MAPIRLTRQLHNLSMETLILRDYLEVPFLVLLWTRILEFPSISVADNPSILGKPTEVAQSSSVLVQSRTLRWTSRLPWSIVSLSLKDCDFKLYLLREAEKFLTKIDWICLIHNNTQYVDDCLLNSPRPSYLFKIKDI